MEDVVKIGKLQVRQFCAVLDEFEQVEVTDFGGHPFGKCQANVMYGVFKEDVLNKEIYSAKSVLKNGHIVHVIRTKREW